LAPQVFCRFFIEFFAAALETHPNSGHLFYQMMEAPTLPDNRNKVLC